MYRWSGFHVFYIDICFLPMVASLLILLASQRSPPSLSLRVTSSYIPYPPSMSGMHLVTYTPLLRILPWRPGIPSPIVAVLSAFRSPFSVLSASILDHITGNTDPTPSICVLS